VSKKKHKAIEKSHIPHPRDTQMRHLRPDSYRAKEPLLKTKLIPSPSMTECPEDTASLITTPLEKTNAGINPQSRYYIRGVLHTHPWSLRVGAFFTLLFFLLTPLTIVVSILVVLSGFISGLPEWISNRLLFLPALLLVFGLGYLIWGRTAKCRICHQPLFVHKAAIKHVKSHRRPCLGHVLPLSLHLLIFSWFRCSSCGTSIRLKK
jgi:hypothetical protein